MLRGLISVFDSYEKKVINELKLVFDPEIPIDVYELGLIYEISFNKIPHGRHCEILMTLTSAWCPEAQSIPIWVRDAALKANGIISCNVEVTFDPPWDATCMSEAARLEAGFL